MRIERVGRQKRQQLLAGRRRRQHHHAVGGQRVAQPGERPWPGPSSGTASVAPMWTMPPEQHRAGERAPADLAQPFGELRHASSPARQPLDGGQRLGGRPPARLRPSAASCTVRTSLMRLPPPIGSQLPGRASRASVMTARPSGSRITRVAVEGVALGRRSGSGRPGCRRRRGSTRPPSRSSMTMAYSQPECSRPPRLSALA